MKQSFSPKQKFSFQDIEIWKNVMTVQENMEKLEELNGGKVTIPQNWKIYILNLMTQPVYSKTDYFLFKLIDLAGGSGPSVASDFCQVIDKLCLHFSMQAREVCVQWNCS